MNRCQSCSPGELMRLIAPNFGTTIEVTSYECMHIEKRRKRGEN